MLSRPVSRCTRASSSLIPSALHTRPFTAATTFAAATSPRHRRSSSKTSTPPGGGSPGPRSSAQPSTAPRTSTNSSTAEVVDKRQAPSATVGRRKQRSQELSPEESALKARHDAFANVPSVPPTTHLAIQDVKLSSLFALDRPISVTKTGYPPYVDSKRFNSIFEPKSTASKVDDTTYTLTSAISALDSAADTQQQSNATTDLRTEILQNSPSNNGTGTIHLDHPPNLEQLSRQYRPFQKPPPPIPLGNPQAVRAEQARRIQLERREAAQMREEKEAQAEQARQRPQKTFTTTLTIREATDEKGEKTYTASASPILERGESPALPQPLSQPPANTQEQQQQQQQRRTSQARLPSARQPFLARMHRREAAHLRDMEERVNTIDARVQTMAHAANVEERDSSIIGDVPALPATGVDDGESNAELEGIEKELLLISVKRQRKLKMKKHKYKKLMRRTRNLRRREGRN